MILAVISLFSIALFARGATFIESAERNQKKMTAFNTAEAGFDTAYRALNDGTIATFPWTSGYVSMNTGNMRGGYSVTVNDMGNEVRQILVTGYSPDQTTIVEPLESRTVTGYVQPSDDTPFAQAVFAVDGMDISGNAIVDSYNSDNGAYGGSNVLANGDVITNGTDAAELALSGNAIVSGDALSGANSNANQVITTTDNAVLTGTKSAQSKNLAVETPTTELTSSGTLKITGNSNYALPAGTYRFDSISISGNGRITPTGAVIIYVDGELSISGNGYIATASSKPANALIYATGTSTISVAGNGYLYAGIYAPNSTVEIEGNGTLYGGVVSDTFNLEGNGIVHYDEALKEISAGESTGYEVLSWAESNPSAATNISSSSHTS